MPKNLIGNKYERRITPLERFFTWSPFSIVTLVVRIKGEVSEKMLIDAASKVQQRHSNLRVRIKEESEGDLWFTSEGVEDIPIEIIPREADDDWIKVTQQASQVPFEFNTRPAIRFILVQSPRQCELIILCHHIICDGLSLAYLARDLMVHLGDPTLNVEILPEPMPITTENIPEDVSINGLVKFMVNRINKKWGAEKIVFDQQDYRDLNEAYWMNYTHQMLSVELSEDETSALVARCRKEEVTVNTALTAAIIGAQYFVQGDQPYHASFAVGGNMRDRLRNPVGEGMGFYAGAITLKHKYNTEIGFWENARSFHKKITPLYTNKKMFSEPLVWCYLEPTILDAFHFKKLGGLVPPHFARYDKLSAFSQRDDVILSLLKRDKMESLEQLIMGTAVTNLTRMDFPREYGALELERLIMHPGGAFPLANVNLVLGAVTCAGKLSLILEYAEERIDTGTAEKIKDKAMELLLT